MSNRVIPIVMAIVVAVSAQNALVVWDQLGGRVSHSLDAVRTLTFDNTSLHIHGLDETHEFNSVSKLTFDDVTGSSQALTRCPHPIGRCNLSVKQLRDRSVTFNLPVAGETLAITVHDLNGRQVACVGNGEPQVLKWRPAGAAGKVYVATAWVDGEAVASAAFAGR